MQTVVLHKKKKQHRYVQTLSTFFRVNSSSRVFSKVSLTEARHVPTWFEFTILICVEKLTNRDGGFRNESQLYSTFGSCFKCIVIDSCYHTGNPIPRVQWLHGETVLATLGAGETQLGPNRSLTLLITNATRSHFANVYTCTADNTLLAPPQQSVIRIDLYCK